MKQIILYNIIFPIWFLLFFPPVIFITLAGNLIIDSLVLVACFFIFNIAKTQINLNTFYKKSIIESVAVWLFGGYNRSCNIVCNKYYRRFFRGGL